MCYTVLMDANITQWEQGGTCGVAEAARIIGYSQDTVLRMIADGDLIGWRKSERGKYLLYRVQVKEVSAKMRAKGIKYAREMQMMLAL